MAINENNTTNNNTGPCKAIAMAMWELKKTPAKRLENELTCTVLEHISQMHIRQDARYWYINYWCYPNEICFEFSIADSLEYNVSCGNHIILKDYEMKLIRKVAKKVLGNKMEFHYF